VFLIARQNRLLRRFRAAGAIRPAYACSLHQLGLRDRRVLESLVGRGVFAAVEGDRFYLVPGNAELFLRQRRSAALVALAVATSLVLARWIASWWTT
jgi:hypothetical protein